MKNWLWEKNLHNLNSALDKAQVDAPQPLNTTNPIVGTVDLRTGQLKMISENES